mmetsp:Transcript_6228/g.25814  ORF Transcript_6228/g.25814 Transcript_6228/m.25814 type:complete len:404 (-) Transcript_6228:1138-2349(-)
MVYFRLLTNNGCMIHSYAHPVSRSSPAPDAAARRREVRGHGADGRRRRGQGLVLVPRRQPLCLRLRVLGQQAGYQVGVVEGLNEMLLQPPLHAVDEKVHHSLGHGIREHAAGDGEVAAEEDPGHQHLEELLVSLGLARLNPARRFLQRHDPVLVRVKRLNVVLLVLNLVDGRVDGRTPGELSAERRLGLVLGIPLPLQRVSLSDICQHILPKVILVSRHLVVVSSSSGGRGRSPASLELLLRHPQRLGPAHKIWVGGVNVCELALHQRVDHALRGNQSLHQEVPGGVLHALRQAWVPLQILLVNQRPRDPPELVVNDPRALDARIRHLSNRLLDQNLEGVVGEEQHGLRARRVLDRGPDVLLAHRARRVEGLQALDKDILKNKVDPGAALEGRGGEIVALPDD